MSTLPPPARSDSLGGSVGWFALSYALGVMGFLALNALAARALGPDDFGPFVVVSTLALVLGQVGLLGVHRAGVREVARLVRYDDAAAGDLRDDIHTVSLVSLPVVGVLTGLVTVLILGGGRGLWPAVAMLTTVAALTYLAGQQKLTAGYLRGLGRVRFAGLLEGRSGGGLVALIQAGLLAVIVAVDPHPALVTVLAALAGAYVVPVFWGHLAINRHWSAGPRETAHLVRLGRLMRRDWRFFVVSTASSASQYVELWIAGAVLLVNDSSYFSAAHRLASLLVIPLASLQVVCSPAISRLWHRQERETLIVLVRTAATLATVLTLALLVPLLMAPGRTMALVFGSSFAPASAVLVVLAVGMVGNVVSGLCGAVLSMTGHEGRSAMVTTTTLVLRLGLGLWAASAFGLIGLAVATSVVTVLHNGWLAMMTLRTIGVSTLPTARPQPRLFFRLWG